MFLKISKSVTSCCLWNFENKSVKWIPPQNLKLRQLKDETFSPLSQHLFQDIHTRFRARWMGMGFESAKRCRNDIYLIFFHDLPSHYGAIYPIHETKKNAFSGCSNKRSAIEKQFIAFFLKHLHKREIFVPTFAFRFLLHGEAVRSCNEWKKKEFFFWDENFSVFHWMSTKSISSHSKLHRGFRYWCCAIFYALLLSILIRATPKSHIERAATTKKEFPRIPHFSSLKPGLARVGEFYGRKPKMNIWQIATGYSDN